MNKQEQIEKMKDEIIKICYNRVDQCRKDTICDSCLSKGLIEAGYINGADFLKWVEEHYKEEYPNFQNLLFVGTLREALQEYLKGDSK